MTAGLNRSSLNTLATQALDAAGLPVVPELKQQLQEQLAKQLLPRLEAMVNQPVEAFTSAGLDQLRAQLSQQLAKTFADASLAAIAELALPQNGTAPRSQAATRILSPEVLSGMSETAEETDQKTSTQTQAPATMTEPSSEAMEAGPGGSAPSGMPVTKPQGKQQGQQQGGQSDRRRRGQPSPTAASEQPTTTGTTPVVGAPAAADATGTSSSSPEEGAIGQPQLGAGAEEGPVEDQTVDQYREQAVGHALQREKNRRVQAGQAQMTAQGEDAHQRGLNIIANEGAKIGAKLKNNIKHGSFASFYICLAVAIVKDIIDVAPASFGDPGIITDVISIFFGGLLSALLFSEGTWFRRWFIKKFLGKAIIALVASFIPVVNEFFPEYTVGVLLMGYDNFFAIEKLKKTLAAHNEMMKKIHRFSKMGPKVGPHMVGNIRKQLSSHRQIADE